MEEQTDRAQLEAGLTAWRTRLRRWGLDGLAAALLDAAEPLSPLGAQMLYVAQPTLGLFVPRARVGRWARLLEDPANISWLRERLLDLDAHKMIPDEEGSTHGPCE